MEDYQGIVHRHVLRYHLNINACLCLIGCQSFISSLMVLRRFIAVSTSALRNLYLNYLLAAFKLFTDHYKQYCNSIFCRTGVNCFWIINNTQQVLSTLNKINYFSKARHFDSYDFSTLYRSIPHAALKEALETLVCEAYKVRDSEFIVADTNGNTSWSDLRTITLVI